MSNLINLFTVNISKLFRFHHSNIGILELPLVYLESGSSRSSLSLRVELASTLLDGRSGYGHFCLTRLASHSYTSCAQRYTIACPIYFCTNAYLDRLPVKRLKRSTLSLQRMLPLSRGFRMEGTTRIYHITKRQEHTLIMKSKTPRRCEVHNSLYI